MWCGSEDCKRPEDWIGTPVHQFAGYGFYVVFHAECCPIECDGTVCDRDHPSEDQHELQVKLLAKERSDAAVRRRSHQARA
jgi:hypothetical protein